MAKTASPAKIAATVERLRAYASTGHPVTSADIKRIDPALRAAIYTCFAGVPEAAEAAGVAHQCKRSWSKEAVAVALRERAAAGRSMTASAILEEDVGLHLACVRYCGSFAKAIEAAGIDREVKERETSWPPEEILRALRERAAAGKPCNAAAVQKEPGGGGLYKGAAKHWGTFDAAVEAAGIEVQRVRAKEWTRESVCEWLRGRYKAGLPNTPSAVRDADWSVYNVALRLFGGVDEAVAAAGLEPERERKAWPQEAVVAELRAMTERGVEMSASGIRVESEGLYGACLRLFGTTEKALAAAGVKPYVRPVAPPRDHRVPAHERKRHAPWTKEALVADIRARSTSGANMSASRTAGEQGGLYDAAVKLFGSWRLALECAGVEYAPLRRDTFLRDDVIAKIAELSAAGVELSSRSIQADEPTLYDCSRRHFGSFADAVLAAGCTPIAFRRHWTKEDVTTAIRGRLDGALCVNYASTSADDAGLVCAAVGVFGSWNGALAAAGIDPVSVSREFEGPLWGRVFEHMMRELLWHVRGDWRFLVRAEQMKPDLYDPARDACVDLKAGAWIKGVDATIAAYAPFCSEVEIVYGRGKPRADEVASPGGRVVPVRFVHWSAYAGTAPPATVATLERLCASDKVPEDLRSLTKWTAPREHARVFLTRKAVTPVAVKVTVESVTTEAEAADLA